MKLFLLSRLDWEVLPYIRVCLSEQKHIFSFEVFVLRRLEHLDCLTGYSLPFATHHITQMKHSHDVDPVKEAAAFTLEEAVSKWSLMITHK